MGMVCEDDTIVILLYCLCKEHGMDPTQFNSQSRLEARTGSAALFCFFWQRCIQSKYPHIYKTNRTTAPKGSFLIENKFDIPTHRKLF